MYIIISSYDLNLGDFSLLEKMVSIIDIKDPSREDNKLISGEVYFYGKMLVPNSNRILNWFQGCVGVRH